MPKQVFEIVRAQEHAPFRAKTIQQILCDKYRNTEIHVSEIDMLEAEKTIAAMRAALDANGAEIARLQNHIKNTANAIRLCAHAVGLSADQSWDDSAAYWGGRMSAQITSMKKQILTLVCDIGSLEIENHNLKCALAGGEE